MVTQSFLGIINKLDQLVVNFLDRSIKLTRDLFKGPRL